MERWEWNIVIAGVFGVLLVLAGAGTGAFAVNMYTMEQQIQQVLTQFIPSLEGFSSTPYWDVNRWSWGYGTAAPGSTGTITQEQALSDTTDYYMNDYASLQPRITRGLNANQWAALLSFSYNLGIGNAYNLLPNINAGDDTALAEQWAKYNKSGGRVNDDLVARRAKEWQLWNS